MFCLKQQLFACAFSNFEILDLLVFPADFYAKTPVSEQFQTLLIISTSSLFFGQHRTNLINNYIFAALKGFWPGGRKAFFDQLVRNQE